MPSSFLPMMSPTAAMSARHGAGAAAGCCLPRCGEHAMPRCFRAMPCHARARRHSVFAAISPRKKGTRVPPLIFDFAVRQFAAHSLRRRYSRHACCYAIRAVICCWRPPMMPRCRHVRHSRHAAFVASAMLFRRCAMMLICRIFLR